MNTSWYLYILQCGDGTLYTGITTDVEKRLEAHKTGKGAKYTRGRGPLILVYQETCESHSHALRRELEIKKMSKNQKYSLFSKETEIPSDQERNILEVSSKKD